MKPTSMMSTSSPIGARCAASLSSRSKSLRPEAARVLSGPGEIACTRMPLAAQLVGEVAAAGFERRLHRPHDVVVRHDLVGAVVAHREHRAAVLHQRRRQPGHAHERMAGDVHRLGEARGRAVEEAALQVFLRREGDRVHQDVEPAPLLVDRLEHRLELARRRDVERQEQRRLQLARQRLDVRPGLLVEVGDREVGAELAERLGAAVGDRAVVGDADDQRLGALQDGMGRRRHGPLSLSVRERGADRRARRGAARPCAELACALRDDAEPRTALDLRQPLGPRRR